MDYDPRGISLSTLRLSKYFYLKISPDDYCWCCGYALIDLVIENNEGLVERFQMCPNYHERIMSKLLLVERMNDWPEIEECIYYSKAIKLAEEETPCPHINEPDAACHGQGDKHNLYYIE